MGRRTLTVPPLAAFTARETRPASHDVRGTTVGTMELLAHGMEPATRRTRLIEARETLDTVPAASATAQPAA